MAFSFIISKIMANYWEIIFMSNCEFNNSFIGTNLTIGEFRHRTAITK